MGDCPTDANGCHRNRCCGHVAVTERPSTSVPDSFHSSAITLGRLTCLGIPSPDGTLDRAIQPRRWYGTPRPGQSRSHTVHTERACVAPRRARASSLLSHREQYYQSNYYRRTLSSKPQLVCVISPDSGASIHCSSGAHEGARIPHSLSSGIPLGRNEHRSQHLTHHTPGCK